MQTLHELLVEQKRLNQQITAMRKAQRDDALAEIWDLLTRHDIRIEDLPQSTKGVKAANASKKPVAAKYADSNGHTWSGRGLKPRWLTQALSEGKLLSDFTI